MNAVWNTVLFIRLMKQSVIHVRINFSCSLLVAYQAYTFTRPEQETDAYQCAIQVITVSTAVVIVRPKNENGCVTQGYIRDVSAGRKKKPENM